MPSRQALLKLIERERLGSRIRVANEKTLIEGIKKSKSLREFLREIISSEQGEALAGLVITKLEIESFDSRQSMIEVVVGVAYTLKSKQMLPRSDVITVHASFEPVDYSIR